MRYRHLAPQKGTQTIYLQLIVELLVRNVGLLFLEELGGGVPELAVQKPVEALSCD